MQNNIQHKAVHVQDFDGNFFRVMSDNADFMIDGSEPFSSDQSKKAIERVAAQQTIEVERGNGRKGTFIWEGNYVALVVKTV